MTVVLGTVSAQTNDDLYFIPKKKAATTQTTPQTTTATTTATTAAKPATKTVSVTAVAVREDGETTTVEVDSPLTIDDDTYNRRGNVRSYIDEEGNYVQEAEVSDMALRVRTADGDTLYYRVDSLIVNQEDDGWVYGFNGDAEDYEYAMRIIRFRNPRYAIPISSPLYWDVVYGGSLWPMWDWNIYDDGLYAYVFPSSYNWYYWDWRFSPYSWHWGRPWGWHGYYNSWYGGWYDPGIMVTATAGAGVMIPGTTVMVMAGATTAITATMAAGDTHTIPTAATLSRTRVVTTVTQASPRPARAQV